MFALAVIADLGARLRSSAEQIRSLAVERVEQRIARTLLKLAETAGSDVPDGRVIEMPLTRQDVADMTGTTVETAIRVMSKFRRLGLIRTRRGKVVLVDREALLGDLRVPLELARPDVYQPIHAWLLTPRPPRVKLLACR